MGKFIVIDHFTDNCHEVVAETIAEAAQKAASNLGINHCRSQILKQPARPYTQIGSAVDFMDEVSYNGWDDCPDHQVIFSLVPLNNGGSGQDEDA